MTNTVNGKCDPKFEAVKAAFENNFASLGEVGASVCVSVGGQTVVDLWGGMADAAKNDPWTEETVSIVFSCTKAATAICAHILIDQGKLDPHALVTDYWPEYGKHGKDKTTVQMMLNHESALPALKDPVKPGGFYDWDYMISRMEDEQPFWEPGTRNGYHMVNFGWTVGELVRRVSGKSLGQFFAENVAGPTGAKFWIGLPEGERPHVAPIIPFSPDPTAPMSDFLKAMLSDPTSIQALSFLNNGGWTPDDPDAYTAEIGGAGGISNARGQVAMYEPLALGGSKGDVTLVSSERAAAMGRVTTATSIDATLLVPSRFASGFMKSMDNRGNRPGQQESAVLSEAAFGHVGAGGSIGFADPDAELAFSYTMNQMGAGLLLNERGQGLIDATYQSLGYSSNASGAWTR